jgi:hypothetical protein
MKCHNICQKNNSELSEYQFFSLGKTEKKVSWWGFIDHSSEAYPVTHGFGIIIHSMAMG